MNELHVKYRPSSWEDVVGHRAEVRAIRRTLEDGSARAFLFTGDPGLGKTTFARLIARTVGIDPETDASSYIEYDGATNTGVDDMRAIQERARLRPLGGNPNRVIVVDEAHMLSKAAWNSALKMVEEPPEGVYWVFCTSEGAKVPASIRSRCQEFVLRELSEKEIGELVDFVIDAEEMVPPSEDVIDLVIESAYGSPRAALVGLGKVRSVESAEEAERILAGVAAEDSVEVIEFCRALMKGGSFPSLAKAVLAMKGTTAEGVRAVVCAYMTKACAGKDWRQAAAILSAFGTPYPAGIGSAMYPVLVSLADLFGEN